MHEEICRLDATAQAALVATKQITALELVDAAIARIERLEPEVHALASSAFEAARSRARGPLGGPFAGVPFLIKDLLGYPGQPLTLGSRLFAAQRAPSGSAFTERCDAAGLITLGKTTTSELGLLGSTESLLFGPTHNPWRREHSAMGSSGGSAAAVASGMVPLAHASDGGGSIRIPAAACGLFGFKPGPGRLVPAMPDDMHGLLIDHVVSRSVRDSAAFLALVEAESSPLGAIGHVRGPSTRRLRIGCYAHTAFGELPEPEVQQALAASAGLCRELGHEVLEVSAPRLTDQAGALAFFTLAGAGIDQLARVLEPMLGAPLGCEQLEPFTLETLARFRALPEGALQRALSEVERVGQEVRAFLLQYDVVLCPTMPIVTPLLGTFAPTLPFDVLVERTKHLAGYTAPISFARAPAMSLPLFASPRGLPIGSQFAARPGSEATLLELAYQLEASAPWAARWPALAV